jgi:hypothetical protein
VKAFAEQENISNTAAALQGVRGWLLLFALATVTVVPAFDAYFICKDVVIFSMSHSFESAVFIIDALMRVIVGSLAVFAGVGLLRERKNAPRHAKTYLLAVLMRQLVLVGFGAGLAIYTGSYESFGSIGGQAFRSCLYVALWYSYFEKSKRVAATFPTSPAVST